MKLRQYVSIIMLVFSALTALGQNIKDHKMIIREIKKPTVCFAGTVHSHFHLPPPEQLEIWKNKKNQKQDNAATFEVDYVGFEGNTAAQTAFQYAVDIWSSLIESEVPIRVLAIWTSSLEPGVLGGAFPPSVIANFDGAQKLNIFYPIALAEKMAGRAFNDPASPDIVALFSNSANWHFDTSTSPVGESFDLATVVLHELGHGLGFFHTYSLSEGQQFNAEVGFNNSGIPVVFDTEVENNLGQILLKHFDFPSAALQAQITSQNLFYNSPKATTNNNSKPKLFAPSTFQQGSSIAHLDEFTYNFTANALMTPSISPGERIHNPGPLTYDIFGDMGWIFTRIEHSPLPNTETTNEDFVVNVKLVADEVNGYGYLVNEVKLTYIIDFNLSNAVTIDMVPGENPDEFTAVIPATGEVSSYGYFISVKDNTERIITNPGKIFSYDVDEEDFQLFHFFDAGPDFDAPEILHQPLPFVRSGEEEIIIDAIVTDNIGVESVILEYQVNEGSINSIALEQDVNDEEYFFININLLPFELEDGDEIHYRFTATDNSSNQNVATLPETGFFKLNVVGLAPFQTSYENDFNSPSNDFFGNNFSIAQPAGFENPAIHSDHPYLDGTGPGAESNYIYQLRIPIEIAAENALMVFDEIALIEPGEPGTVFGSSQFWDYVIVEGSKDGGISWAPVIDGYDARSHAAWLTRYNSGFDASGNNSTGIGDPTLFRNRTINLLSKYAPGDIVVFRFRLFADELAHGWGWAIDNLRIQIDETPPLILHDHIDFLLPNQNQITLNFIIEDDPSGLDAVQVEFKFNDDELQVFDFPILENVNQYIFNIDLQNSLSANDIFSYRILATDGAQNSSVFPAEGFIQAPVFVTATPVSTYVNDFNTASSDFVGNFISITRPQAFLDNAMHTMHPYPLGRGLNKTSSFTYTLKTPVIINGNNPFLVFDEIAIVEPRLSAGALFGSTDFKDYVIVEVSKNGGETWQKLIDGWDAVDQTIWRTAFLQQSIGNPSMFRTRFINMINTGAVAAGETVLFRFRLFSDATVRGWGWAIDNIQIQGPITSVEEPVLIHSALQLYPNPANNLVAVKLELPGSNGQVQINLLNMMGKVSQQQILTLEQGNAETVFDVRHLPAGQYIIRVNTDKLNLSKKLLILK
jgi:hypothetical protein